MTYRDSDLNTAYAYWRLARKAEKAGNRTEAARYRELAAKSHARYQRNRDFIKRTFGK